MYEYWYDYAKLKYGDKAKGCYTASDSLIVYVKSEEVYTDLEGDIEQRLDTSNCKVNRFLTMGKNK